MQRFLAIVLVLFGLAAGPAAAVPPPADGVAVVPLADGVAFRVDRADVGSLRVQVFDQASDALLHDSGWRTGQEVTWRPAGESPGPWRYRLEARDGRGALVLSQTAVREVRPAAVDPRTSHGPSVFSVGSSGSTGEIRTFLEGSTVAVCQLDGTAGGGRLRLVDEQGFTLARLEPDNNGTGVFWQLFRDAGASGLFFDGNKNGSGEPLLSLTGSLQSATIDLSMVEDEAVVLPTSSIGASEMFNEPGAASTNSTTGLANPGDTTLLVRTLTAPAIGRVLAIGTVQMDVVHTEGTNDAFDIGIALGGTTIPSEQNFDTELDGDLPSGLYRKTVTVHGLFEVPAGSNTFRLLLDVGSGGSISVAERQLSLVYLPTIYGLVSPIGSVVPQSAGAEEAALPAETGAIDEAAEREESRAVTAERVRREVAAMRQRLQELEALLAEQGEERR